MFNDEDLILSASAFVLINEDEPKQKRCVWVRPIV